MSAETKTITVQLSETETDTRDLIINSDEKFQRFLEGMDAFALVNGKIAVAVFEELQSGVVYKLWQRKSGTSIANQNAIESMLEGVKQLFIEYHKPPPTIVSVSRASDHHLEMLTQKAHFELQSYRKSIKPSQLMAFRVFPWDPDLRVPESSQSKQYIEYLEELLTPFCAERECEDEFLKLDVYDVKGMKTCLSTKALVEIVGMEFRGTTDVLIAYGRCKALCMLSSLCAVELKKTSRVADRGCHIQAVITLVLLNLKSNQQCPFLLLTDLNDYFMFYWLGRPTANKLPIWMYKVPNTKKSPARSSAYGILNDALREACDKLATDVEDPIELVVGMPRERLPLERFETPAASDVADMADVLPPEEARDCRVLQALMNYSNIDFSEKVPARSPSPPGFYA